MPTDTTEKIDHERKTLSISDETWALLPTDVQEHLRGLARQQYKVYQESQSQRHAAYNNFKILVYEAIKPFLRK